MKNGTREINEKEKMKGIKKSKPVREKDSLCVYNYKKWIGMSRS